MSDEKGVNVINGNDGRSQHPSRSQSPSNRKSVNMNEEQPKRFQNGWTREQERLMADWSDIALCYRWLHDQSEKIFHTKTLSINLPVIILSTLGGTANFGIQSLFENDDNAKKYASFLIGGISLLAGLLTTVGNYLRYAQKEESHRVASISWGKFQRLIAVELSLSPNERMDSLDFLKICRADLDRLIEQSPPIPVESIKLFEEKFGTIKDLKKPDICGALEHTPVFKNSESRLKMMATEAALMLKRKKHTLNELVTPQMESIIAEQVQIRLNEAIETRKKEFEEEIKTREQEAERVSKEQQQIFEERKKKLEEEIELEKKKLNKGFKEPPKIMRATSRFENRINHMSSGPISTSTSRRTSPSPTHTSSSASASASTSTTANKIKNQIENHEIYSFNTPEIKPPEIKPKINSVKIAEVNDDNIIIVDKD